MRYPIATKPSEEAKQKQWRNGDAKARMRIELAIRDAEMMHISGVTSAKEMWEQLTMVKESRGMSRSAGNMMSPVLSHSIFQGEF